jgi:PadR family transcriptional regulator, regulatory protein PadR
MSEGSRLRVSAGVDIRDWLCLGCLGMEGDLVRGHLDLMLLAVLSEGSLHGYGLVEELRRRSGGSLDLPEGTVYPALYRLERRGLIGSHWSADAPRRRRVYRLQAAGHAALASERKSWQDIVGAVNAVIGEAR